MFASGGIVGGITVWYYLKKKYETIAEQEIAEVRDFYTNKCDFLENRVNEAEKMASEPAELKLHSEISGEIIRHGRVDYTRFNKVEPVDIEHPVDSDEDEAMDENEAAGFIFEKEHKEELKQKPKIIRVEQFGERREYETQTLEYYVEDNVLCDEEGDAIEDVERCVGDALEKYGFKDNDEQSLYVRNPSYGVDYVIVKVFGSYQDYHDM